MVSCPICGEQNANKNCFCSACGGRIRPVSRRLEQDILAVIAKHKRKNLGRNLTIISLCLGVLGFFGYGWIKHKIDTTVASQIEVMKPEIVKQANAKADELLKRELPKVVANAAEDTIQGLASDLRWVGQKGKREIEEIYENGKQEAKDRTQKVLASYDDSKIGLISPTMPTVGSFVAPGSTFLDSINTPRAFATSDSTTLGMPALTGPSAGFLNMSKPTDPTFQITSSSSIITTQALSTPSCFGSGGFVADASGTLRWKSNDCKDNPSAPSLNGLIGSEAKPIQ